jgi:hypothetical protein
MNALDEAWNWYQALRQQARLMERLAEHYWVELPWEGRLGHDDHFRALDQGQVRADAQLALSRLDDQAVVVLFSSFESLVRQQVRDEIEQEVPALRHRALKLAAVDTLQRVDEGSFFHVLQPFKDAHADLVEEVNQVRRYRNWAAHGGRGPRPSGLTPRMAFDRLSRFLQALGIGGRADTPAPGQGPP